MPFHCSPILTLPSGHMHSYNLLLCSFLQSVLSVVVVTVCMRLSHRSSSMAFEEAVASSIPVGLASPDDTISVFYCERSFFCE